MIVDENLNDVTHLLVKQKNKLLRLISILIIAIVFLSVLLTVATIASLSNKKEIKILTTQVEQDEQMLTLEYAIGYWFINAPEHVNDSVLYNFLVENGAWYPDILLKQAKLESGNYTSNVFMNSCNLYGMRKVGKRQTTQIGIYNGYGVYNNWCLSVLDRMLWDVFRFKNKKPSREEYLKALGLYAEDNNYINKLK